MMKVCPQCGDEFRQSAVMCNRCQVELLDAKEHRASESPKAQLSFAQRLSDVETATLLEGTLDACREVERALVRADIPVLLERRQPQGPQNLGSAQTTRYALWVARDDLPRAAGVLEEGFASMVAREGTGSLMTEAIDLSAAEITCPACGHVGALISGRCGDCELFLGEG